MRNPGWTTTLQTCLIRKSQSIQSGSWNPITYLSQRPPSTSSQILSVWCVGSNVNERLNLTWTVYINSPIDAESSHFTAWRAVDAWKGGVKVCQELPNAGATISVYKILFWTLWKHKTYGICSIWWSSVAMSWLPLIRGQLAAFWRILPTVMQHFASHLYMHQTAASLLNSFRLWTQCTFRTGTLHSDASHKKITLSHWKIDLGARLSWGWNGFILGEFSSLHLPHSPSPWSSCLLSLDDQLATTHRLACSRGSVTAVLGSLLDNEWLERPRWCADNWEIVCPTVSYKYVCPSSYNICLELCWLPRPSCVLAKPNRTPSYPLHRFSADIPFDPYYKIKLRVSLSFYTISHSHSPTNGAWSGVRSFTGSDGVAVVVGGPRRWQRVSQGRRYCSWFQDTLCRWLGFSIYPVSTRRFEDNLRIVVQISWFILPLATCHVAMKDLIPSRNLTTNWVSERLDSVHICFVLTCSYDWK